MTSKLPLWNGTSILESQILNPLSPLAMTRDATIVQQAREPRDLSSDDGQTRLKNRYIAPCYTLCILD